MFFKPFNKIPIFLAIWFWFWDLFASDFLTLSSQQILPVSFLKIENIWGRFSCKHIWYKWFPFFLFVTQDRQWWPWLAVDASAGNEQRWWMYFLQSPYIKYSVNAFYCKTTTLLSSLCWQFEAKKRASAEDGLRHSYFRSLGEQVQTLADSEYTQFNILNRRSVQTPSHQAFVHFSGIHLLYKRHSAPEGSGEEILSVPRVR